jgi:hypothetical protein
MRLALDRTVESKERTDAIKFLIHLVADATQPLHTGFREDIGRKEVELSGPRQVDLHVFWEFDLLETFGQQSGKRADGLLQDVKARMADGHLVPDSEFATHSVGGWIVSRNSQQVTCAKAYKIEKGAWIASGESLSDAYIADRISVVQDQLALAASYLGQILNYISHKYMDSKHCITVDSICRGDSDRASF